MEKRCVKGKIFLTKNLSARPEPHLMHVAEGGLPFFLFIGFIAKHLFVFTYGVSQYHAFDNRRPNQKTGLISNGPCVNTGYAQAGNSSM